MQTVRSVKVTTLADNVVYDGRLWGQFDFSAHLEIKEHNGKKHSIIFDTARAWLEQEDKRRQNIT